MLHERGSRGPASQLLWLIAAILVGGFVVVWGWNFAGAAMFGGPQIAYQQALVVEVAIATLAVIVRLAMRTGDHRGRSRHATTTDTNRHG